MIKNFYLKIACLATAILCAASCVDTGDLESQLSGLEDRVSALEQTASKVNENTIAIYSMLVEGNIIMDVKAHENGTVYSLELSDGSSVDIYISETGEGITPVIGVDENGDWIYSLDGEEFLPVPGMDEDGMGSAIPQFRVSENFVWEISTDGGATWIQRDFNVTLNKITAEADAITGLVYQDGTPGVSSRHCQIAFDEQAGQFLVTDLNSTYGTFLADGQRLAPNTPVKLPPKSSIYLGEVANTIYLELG